MLIFLQFLDLRLHRQVAPGNSSTLIPFRFEMAKRPPNYSLNACSALANNETCLPPTLHLKPSRSQIGAQATAHVSYYLDAHAVVDGLATCSVRKQVFVEDDTPSVPPPISTEDFPGEYNCSKSKRISGFWFQRRTLSVVVSQPSPVTFRAHHDEAVVYGLFRMYCSSPKGIIEQSTAVALQWQLQTTTFVSVVPMTKSPTVAQASRSHCIGVSKTHSKPSYLDMKLCRWHQTQELDGMWETAFQVVLVLRAPRDRLPTFSSPFLCRRYSLGFHLKVRPHVWTNYELTVPLHVMYEANAV